MPLIYLALAGLTLVLLLLLWWQNRTARSYQELSKVMQSLTEQQQNHLQYTTNLLLQQLGRHQESQERTSHSMHNRIDAAINVVSTVQGKLLQLEEANKRIFELGKDISSLQRILQAPKLRGGVGEIWLAELISQIIPAEHFKLQYTFKSGEICDAVIFLRDGLILPIDSKFSLENFNKMLEAEDREKLLYQRQFVNDVKKRIDEVAKKYILPHEGTMEFAFMYIPAENVYYQAFIQDEDTKQLLSYAFSRHIIPVSPSSFYAYLQVILFGLRGLEIEKSAKEIRQNLGGLQSEFEKFKDVYGKVGLHLRNAQQNFELGDKRLAGTTQKLEQLTSSPVPTATQLSAEHEEL